MSEPSTTPVRPPNVTVAGVIVIVGSVFVVLQMWDRISGLQSVDTRTSLTSFLDASRLGGAGLDVAQLTTIVRVASMAAAGCATAMLVLGWHVTHRSSGARMVLSLLAGPLLLSGLVSDWFVGSVAATFWACGIDAAVATLWLGPSRLWFSGAPDAAPATRGAASSPPTSPATPPPPPRLAAPVPPPSQEQPPPMQERWPPTAWAPPATTPYDGPHPPLRRRRPPALLWACLLTWFCTGFAALILVVSIVTLAQDAQPVLDEAYRQNPQLSEQGFSQHELLVVLYAVIGLVLAGSAAAAAFAVVLFRGHRWAWYALLATVGVSTLFFLISALGSPVGLLPVAASAVTIACLMRPEVRAWLARR